MDLQPRDERSVELKARVLGRAPDQHDGPVLDVREQRILLRLVPPGDLIDEQQRPPTDVAALLGPGDDRPQLLDAVRDRVELLDLGIDRAGHAQSDRRLAGTRRAPEDHRMGRAGLKGDAQGRVGRGQLRLAHDLVQCPRAHPFGQGSMAKTHRGAEGQLIIHSVHGTCAPADTAKNPP